MHQVILLLAYQPNPEILKVACSWRSNELTQAGSPNVAVFKMRAPKNNICRRTLSLNSIKHQLLHKWFVCHFLPFAKTFI